MKVVKGHIETPQRTYFFERHDGSVIALQEREAWAMMKHPGKSLGPIQAPPKFIGSSDGVIYRDAVAAARVIYDANGGVYDEACRELLLKAEKDEMAKARGNMVMPRDFDTIDKNGLPINLATLR